MFAIMFAISVTYLVLVTIAGLMAWVGDIRNEIKARRVFPKIASEIRTPRYVVNDDGLDDPFFDLPDEPTEEVPADRYGCRPPSICPPMLADSGLAQVMAAHLRKRIK